MKGRILTCLVLALILSACTLRFASREPVGVPVTAESSAPRFAIQETLRATTPVLSNPTQPASDTLSPTPTSTPFQSLAGSRLKFPAEQFRYTTQPGTPVGVINFVAPNAGCSWMGVAGQVFDKNSAPVSGLFVVVSGRLAGQEIGPLLAMTGSEQALGPGGYTIQISRQALDSNGTLFLQLFDVNNLPQSPRIYFDTYANCDQNMILFNFIERVTLIYLGFLPQTQIFYWPYSVSIPIIGR